MNNILINNKIDDRTKMQLVKLQFVYILIFPNKI